MYYHNMAGDGLGKFGLKKIKRTVKKAVKGVTKAVVTVATAPLTVPAGVAKTAIKAAAPIVSDVVKVGGGLVSALVPTSPAPGSEYVQPGQSPYGQPGGYGEDAQGGQGFLGGMSPLMIGLAVGIPAILLFVMKGKK